MLTNILYIETSLGGVVGGSFFSLLELIKGLNKNQYHPFVLFHENNYLVQDFLNAGARVSYLSDKDNKHKEQDFIITKNSFIRRHAWNILDAVSIGPTIRIFRGIKKQSRFASKAESIIVENEINMVHVNNGLTPGLPYIRAARKYNLPIIIHERRIRNHARIERMFVKHVQCVICISNAVRENFIFQFPDFDKEVTIYNPVTSNLFVDDRKKASIIKELAISENSPIICQISNLIHSKGQDTLIEAIRILKEKMPRLILLIVGGVPHLEKEYAKKLKSMVRGYSLDQNVRFCGFRKDKELFFDLADIVVHVPSMPEAFGRTVLEAMQLKKPVISSNIGGTTELIENGINGLLVAPKAPKELADAIFKLASNRALRERMGMESQKIAKKKFSLGIFHEKISEIYSEVLARAL